MKKLFTVIRQGKLDEVARILDKNPALISCTATAPPKKDHGQSPLMVAIKSDNLEVAHLLLDRGADVNFRDAPNPYGMGSISAPIWYDAIGQCFLRASHTVGPGLERSKSYFLLLRRLLDMGMDPNQKTIPGYLNAWQYALDQYDQFAHDSYTSYYVEETKIENRQLQEMLKAILDLLLAHGADIHAHQPPNEDGLPISAVLLRNLEEGRKLLDGFYGLDPAKLTPYTITYRGREHTYQPRPVEEQRKQYEIKWRKLEPILRGYYEKEKKYDNQRNRNAI